MEAGIHGTNKTVLVGVHALHPNQHLFSHDGTEKKVGPDETMHSASSHLGFQC